MARVAVPVIALQYPSELAFSNVIQDLFAANDAWQEEDQFTYTGRATVYGDDENADAKKAKITAGLHLMETNGILQEGQADTLLTLLEKHDWDISFFVDCY